MGRAVLTAILTVIVTVLVGYVGMVLGHELWGGFPEFGSVFAIAAAAGLIVFFSETKK